MTNVCVRAIPADYLDRVRDRSHDLHGNRLVPSEDGDGGTPLRCCLRDSRPGERIVLVAYAPLPRAGPYWELGPVFIHAEPCGGYPTPERYPPQFRDRTQVLRAYGQDQTIVGGAVVKPDDDQDAVVAALLAEPGTAFLHARNPVYGCYMFEIAVEDGQATTARRSPQPLG